MQFPRSEPTSRRSRAFRLIRHAVEAIGRREVVEVDPQVWAECLSDVANLRARMAAVSVDDTAAWAQLAKETSGVLDA